MNHHCLTRREALAAGAGLMAAPAFAALAADKERLFKIGACDWSLGKSANVAAFDVAKEIGLDGVQVSFGAPGGRYDLRKADVRREFADATKKTGVQIASLAMGVLNGVPYSSSRQAEQWVDQCIDVAAAMDQKVVLLAFFGKGDIRDKPELTAEVIRRLKKVAPKAEKTGVVLGLETWLSVKEHLHILDAVGSPAVQVYYDVANMTKQGYDIYKEIRQLGRQRICEIHCKENGHLLGKGPVDFPKVKAAVDDVGYRGWLIIEGAVAAGLSREESYKLNQKYLRSVFPTARS